MDSTEAHVQKNLQHIGHRNIVYEPDGNVPKNVRLCIAEKTQKIAGVRA